MAGNVVWGVALWTASERISEGESKWVKTDQIQVIFEAAWQVQGLHTTIFFTWWDLFFIIKKFENHINNKKAVKLLIKGSMNCRISRILKIIYGNLNVEWHFDMFKKNNPYFLEIHPEIFMDEMIWYLVFTQEVGKIGHGQMVAGWWSYGRSCTAWAIFVDVQK